MLNLWLAEIASDPGCGWHIRTGEYILEKFSIPRVDPFLTIARPWISDQWLSDIILATVYKTTQWPGLYCLTIVIFLITFFGISKETSMHLGSAPFAAFIGSAIALVFAKVHFIIRPVTFSFLCFAALYYLLILCLKSDNLKSKLIYAFPLFLIWANLHPAFVLGGALLCLALGSDFIYSTNKATTLKRSVVIALLCGAITLINPYIHNLHFSILLLGQSDFFMNLNMEWKPLDLTKTIGISTIIIICLCSAEFFLRRKRFTALDLFQCLAIILFAILSIKSVRILPYFGLVASPTIALFLSRIKLNSNLPILRALPGIALYENRSTKGLLALSTLIILLPAYTLINHQLPIWSGEYGPPKSIYPYKAVSYLNKKHKNEKVGIFSTPDWGGFLTFHGQPGITPAIDDRNTLLGEDVYRDYLKGEVEINALIHRAHLERSSYILLPNTYKSIQQLKSTNKLSLVYEDEICTLFLLSPLLS